MGVHKTCANKENIQHNAYYLQLCNSLSFSFFYIEGRIGASKFDIYICTHISTHTHTHTYNKFYLQLFQFHHLFPFSIMYREKESKFDIYIYAHTYIHTHTLARTLVHPMCTHTHTYTRTHTCVHTHTYTHMCTHTHTHLPSFLPCCLHSRSSLGCDDGVIQAKENLDESKTRSSVLPCSTETLVD